MTSKNETLAFRLAAWINAINVLVASGFSIAGLVAPQAILPAGAALDEASFVFSPRRHVKHRQSGRSFEVEARPVRRGARGGQAGCAAGVGSNLGNGLNVSAIRNAPKPMPNEPRYSQA